MADTITYRGSAIWSNATDGAGYSFRPATPRREVMETRAPNGGVGYWIQDNGVEAVTHTLEVAWRHAVPATLLANIQAAAMDSTLGSLVVPVWGTFTNCRLEGVEWGESQGSDGVYLIRATLTFRQYP